MEKGPESIELVEDVAPARWIEERLWRWPRRGAGPSRVGSFMPEGFAAYARVFHPARLAPGNEPVRWSTVASWTGRTVHPMMQFGSIANLPEPHRNNPPWGSVPSHGSLPPEECRTLAGLLREFTATPDRCYFCVWEGYGFHDRRRYRNARSVEVPHRTYLLFRGPLEAIMSIPDVVGSGLWRQSPNIWWPEGRAWCVTTEIDLFDTYVGGSEACIQRVLSCPDLEALPTTIEAWLSLDPINT